MFIQSYFWGIIFSEPAGDIIVIDFVPFFPISSHFKMGEHFEVRSILRVIKIKSLVRQLAGFIVYSVDDDPGFRDVDPPAKQAIRVRA